jgi:hypothetical protein
MSVLDSNRWWVANPGIGGTVRQTTSAWSAEVLAADQATSGTTLGEPQTFRSVTALIIWWVWVLFAVGNLVDLAVQGRDHVSLVAAGILVMATGVAYVTAQRPRIIADGGGITVRNPLRDHRVPWASIIKVDLADLLRIYYRPPGTDSGSYASTGMNTDLSAYASTSMATDLGVDTDAGADNDLGPGKAKVISAWAVHYSRRRQFTAEAKERRAVVRASRTARLDGGSNGISRTFGLARYSGGSRQVGGFGRAGVGNDPDVRDTSSEAEALRIARLLNDQVAAARGERPAGSAQPAEATGAEPATSVWSRQAIAALLIPAVLLLVICLI